MEDMEDEQELEEAEQIEEPEQPRRPETPSPQVELDWKMEAADFADAIKAVEAVVAYGLEAKETREATFHVDADGIQVSSMDQSRVGMVMFDLRKHGFEEFHVKTPGLICFNSNDIKSSLKGVKRTVRDEDGTIKTEGDKLNLQIRTVDSHIDMILALSGNGYDRTWNLRAIESESDEAVPEPKLTFNVKFTAEAAKLKRILADAALTGASAVKVTAENNEVVFKADGDDTAKMFTGKLPRESGLFSLEMKEPATATYNIGFLLNIISNVPKTAETVTFSFSKDRPCKIEAAGHFDKLTYYVAPRIESE